jgi:hypothetical protein
MRKRQDLLAQFDRREIEHNLRGKNAMADKLANLAMDRRADVHDADTSSAEIDLPSAAGTNAGQRFACARCGCEIDVRTPTVDPPASAEAVRLPVRNQDDAA